MLRVLGQWTISFNKFFRKSFLPNFVTYVTFWSKPILYLVNSFSDIWFVMFFPVSGYFVDDGGMDTDKILLSEDTHISQT